MCTNGCVRECVCIKKERLVDAMWKVATEAVISRTSNTERETRTHSLPLSLLEILPIERIALSLAAIIAFFLQMWIFFFS